MMAAWSAILMAETSSKVSTRRLVSSHTMRGTLTRGSAAKFSANRSALAASARYSTSFSEVWANSSMSPGTLARDAMGR